MDATEVQLTGREAVERFLAEWVRLGRPNVGMDIDHYPGSTAEGYEVILSKWVEDRVMKTLRSYPRNITYYHRVLRWSNALDPDSPRELDGYRQTYFMRLPRPDEIRDDYDY